jgi:hypothetical protein
MQKKLIFLNDPDQIKKINLNEINDSTIFSFNIYVHKELEKKNIKHKIAETYLSKNDKIEIINKTIELLTWYNDDSVNSSFKLYNVNFLSLLDSNELHLLILERLYNFVIVKRIIESENIDSILMPNSFFKSMQSFVNIKKINVKTFSIDDGSLVFDTFRFTIPIGSYELPISISRKKFIKYKKLFEKIICTSFSLWMNTKKQNKSVILIEFNPITYEKLLNEIKKTGVNIILLNRRRSAIWNYEAFKIIQKNNCKILNSSKILKSFQSEFEKYSELLPKKLDDLWGNNDFFESKFQFEGCSFWHVIKDTLLFSIKSRIPEFLEFIFISNYISTSLNITSILSLYENGELEKSILQSTKNQIPSVLLEHAYVEFIEENSRFDFTTMHTTFNDKIAVWGNKQKNYLTNFRKTNPNSIIVSGSPRHDVFFNTSQENLKINFTKKFLIIPSPIINATALIDTQIFLKYEELVKKTLNILKSFSNIEISVKLHPVKDSSNDFLRKIISNIDPKIKIFQDSSIVKHIRYSDAIIILDAQQLGPSTPFLESLILKKPIMFITVDDEIYPYDCATDGSCIYLRSKDDLEKPLFRLLNDKETIVKLIEYGQLHLSHFLSNPGSASKKLANALISLNSN